ncbi:hypothetical protein [Micromonospora zhanjiangensis]|uniref:DUF5302 domain-containing protein n=1 Tax=Micromonospora zhanjiangensis TaxID=1522057 RepID=A0ABV8KMM7_9ACTN
MPDPGTPKENDAAETVTDADAGTDGSPAEDESAVFQNRAARRAKTTAAKQRQIEGKAKQFGGRGSVQGPRQWGNRRSG